MGPHHDPTQFDPHPSSNLHLESASPSPFFSRPPPPPPYILFIPSDRRSPIPTAPTAFAPVKVPTVPPYPNKPNANPNCNPLPLFHARCRPNNPFAQRHHFHQRQTDLPSTSSNRLQSSESLSRHNCVLQHVHTPRPFVLIQPAPCGALNSTNGCLTGMNQDLL